MTPTKVITPDELAAILGWPTYRVETWVDELPGELKVEVEGGRGLDPVKFAAYLNQASAT